MDYIDFLKNKMAISHNMGFDVIYINPLKEEFFEEIDVDNLSKLNKELQIDEILSFKERYFLAVSACSFKGFNLRSIS